MRSFAVSVGILILAQAPPVPAAPAGSAEKKSDFVVHEWGTFLSVQGSDGATLDGMYHEEHSLPLFVHARSRDQLRLPHARMKGETPVIYFYGDQEERVEVEVGFPKGIWTQWYPQASIVRPGLATAGSFPALKAGRITWNAHVMPRSWSPSSPVLPATPPGSLWDFARDVDACYVSTHDSTRDHSPKEFERFLFYRGLGRADLPVAISLEEGGSLTAKEVPGAGLREIFVLRVEGGRGAFHYLPSLRSGETLRDVVPSAKELLPREEFLGRVAGELAARLAAAGLFPKEAQAMVNTWRASYFATEGIRALFVLPQDWTERFIPMKLSPRPKELVRVMVGRLEALTPEREREAAAAVKGLSSPDAEEREAAFARLRKEGRYLEPVVRRVLASSKDEATRALARRLLLSDFVTELRTALEAAPGIKDPQEKPVFLRAQLASLLHEIGLDAEARAEAERARGPLTALGIPPLDQEGARHPLRAWGRVMEGLGDERGAADRFGRFIDFAAQLRSREECGSCHDGNATPRTMVWYRDWWAGERYAKHAASAEGLETAIAQRKTALDKKPDAGGETMRLAYLYQLSGQKDLAEKLWRKLESPETGSVKGKGTVALRNTP